ncbi:MAG: hypothetical protein IJE28_01635, partial [Oscillospiraceae bacterium]|nr:hypothetical protein [Oscillospiraceae bacterium]
MKKLISLASAICFVFLLGITANAAEAPLRLFSVSPEEGFSEDEIYSYAVQNAFGGVLVDLRNSDSADFLWNITNPMDFQPFKTYFIVKERHLDEIKPGRNLVFSSGISEEAIAEYSAASGSETVSFLLPFGDENAAEIAEYFYGKGYFKTLFVENLLSCHSENGY